MSQLIETISLIHKTHTPHLNTEFALFNNRMLFIISFVDFLLIEIEFRI